jgi:hypothetical protein
MFEKWKDILGHLIDPLNFLIFSISYIPGTIYSLIITGQFSVLLSLSAFKHAWFARVWEAAGPSTREASLPKVITLIPLARGVVLEVGPGSGEWVDLYDKEKVTKIYGVEPNKDHHESLRKRIKEAGLSDIYVIVPVGIEELGMGWVRKEEVDSMVTIQCLCSIPTPEKLIDLLYEYIKPGGQWFVYEHVVTHGGFLMEMYQGE